MVMIDAFNKILEDSYSDFSMNILSVEDLETLKDFDDNSSNQFFINNLINFFASKYNCDILSEYKDYLNKCYSCKLNQFTKIIGNS